MSYGLIPEGPARRAVVFGGSNAHIMSDEAHGAPVNRDAARALMALLTSPEWSLKNNWTDSNPANLLGFETEWMKQRLEEIKFLEVTTAMLPYGIPFPVVPESPEVMNIIIPEMLQNALTETMTVEEAANDAARPRCEELRRRHVSRTTLDRPAASVLPASHTKQIAPATSRLRAFSHLSLASLARLLRFPTTPEA